MSVVNRIICLVEKYGLTGKQFGEIIGLKKSPLTDWKNQKSKPTLEQIILICEYFAVSSEYILFGKNPDQYSNNVSTSDEENELLINYKKLSYENKSIIKGEIFKLIKEQVYFQKKEENHL